MSETPDETIARLTAGADPTPVEEGTRLRPGQWIACFNEASAEQRLATVEALLEGADTGLHCRIQNHRAQIAEARPRVVGLLTDPTSAPLGTTVVFPADQDEHHPRLIAIRWAPPYDADEEHPWLIVGSEGPQRLSHDSVEGCEVLSATLVYACATADTEG